MTTFEQFAKARYASLQQQRADLYAQLRTVQKEIEEIERASKASGLQLVDSQRPNVHAVNLKNSSKRNMTMKEAAVEILQKHPRGLLATEILSELNKLLKTNYARSSLSPQLSRLKNDGIIYDTGGIWTLSPRVSMQHKHT